MHWGNKTYKTYKTLLSAWSNLVVIYSALIQPHLEYGRNCGITLQNKIQKLQDRAARVLTYSNYEADAAYLFELFGWETYQAANTRSYNSL